MDLVQEMREGRRGVSKELCEHEHLGEKVLPMVMHTVSKHVGHLISHQRRYRMNGVWVTWPDHPRPMWYPARLIVLVSR